MSISLTRSATSIASACALVLLSACSTVSEATRQEVARSDSAVKQAQASLGNSEAGAVELQQARDNLFEAQKALEAGNETSAQRYATKAELNAQLAVQKSRTAGARKSADELLASIQTLRQETERSNMPR